MRHFGAWATTFEAAPGLAQFQLCTLEALLCMFQGPRAPQVLRAPRALRTGVAQFKRRATKAIVHTRPHEQPSHLCRDSLGPTWIVQRSTACSGSWANLCSTSLVHVQIYV
eukprot:10164380-Alexandrium_andersonii.AAC.1